MSAAYPAPTGRQSPSVGNDTTMLPSQWGQHRPQVYEKIIGGNPSAIPNYGEKVPTA